MNIIFLDIDGVLNAEDDFGPGNNNPHIGHNRGISTFKVKLLKEIVDASNASLVLVSSWKKRYIKYLNNKEDEVGEYLFNKLNEVGLSIYDTTIRYDYDDGKSRGIEIALWLIDHKNDVDKYILIDDDERIDYEKFDILPHLVKTSPLTGLTKDIVKECINKLS
ncbi:MAG: hypothetical protein J5666_02535 [Bacilli bacterium]|nr:hypothetical protein [Bacilli bacterium]